MRGAKWLQWDAVSGRATPGLAERGPVPEGAQSSSVRACQRAAAGADGGAAAGRTKRGLPSTEGRGDSSVAHGEG